MTLRAFLNIELFLEKAGRAETLFLSNEAWAVRLTERGLSIHTLLENVEPLLNYFERFYKEHSLTMSVVTTNDNAARLRPAGVDRDGVAVPAASLAGLQVTVDKPDVASVAPDPANPGTWLVTPLPATDPNVGARTVVVTTTDPATGASVQNSIEFDPGVETGLSVTTEIVPLAALSTGGDTTGTGQAAGDQTGGAGDQSGQQQSGG